MDWRHNQWVGVGAAVLLVVAIVGLFLWMQSGGGSLATGIGPGMIFQCDATKETFVIPGKDLDKEDVYLAYFNRAGVAAPCKIDDQNDAYWVYWCPQCKKYYKVNRTQITSDSTRCPEGHPVDIYLMPDAQQPAAEEPEAAPAEPTTTE